jgi:hypothetical protein
VAGNIMRTHFKAGGLRGLRVDAFPAKLCAPANWPVPEYIDSKPYCLPSSNQGNTSACAGFATAGYIEVQAWVNHDFYRQVDGLAVYQKAKELDYSAGDGTTLEFALAGAQALGYLQCKAGRQVSTKRDLQYALHHDYVCIAGFQITEGWNYTDVVTGLIGSDETGIGGHAVLLCGYGPYGVEWQNSWDASWGNRGFGRMTWDQFAKQFMYALVIE